MRFQTLAEILRGHAASRPDRIALRADARTWTYRALHEDAARVAQALRAEGVSRGDRVAILDRNVPEYLTTIFGASLLDAVTLGVNWRLAPPEIEYVLNHGEARVLLIGEEFLGHLAKMKLPTVKRVVVIGADAIDGGVVRHADWLAPHEPIDPGVDCDPDATCYQLYTSGTTGLPKGVELSHRNLITAFEIGARDWRIDERSVVLVAMPMFHIAGSGSAITSCLVGGEAVLLRDLEPKEVLRSIEAHRVTNALFVPAVLRVLSALPEAATTDFRSLRTIIYGASPISEEVLVRSMKVFGCGFVQVYGLTETSGAITVLLPDEHDPGGPRAHLLRAAGRPWGDVELRIVDAATRQALPEGEVGEVWCRSRQNMRGYWRNDEATRAVFPEGRDAAGLGWFRSGDAGYLKDGYLFIHDRVKDMIVSGGENVYPAEVENVLMAHAAVADVAVIGVPSEQWGEAVKAIVVDEPGRAATDEELIAWCRERLAGYKCPRSIDRVDVLPRNPSGKLLKTRLREPYWKGQSRQVH